MAQTQCRGIPTETKRGHRGVRPSVYPCRSIRSRAPFILIKATLSIRWHCSGTPWKSWGPDHPLTRIDADMADRVEKAVTAQQLVIQLEKGLAETKHADKAESPMSKWLRLLCWQRSLTTLKFNEGAYKPRKPASTRDPRLQKGWDQCPLSIKAVSIGRLCWNLRELWLQGTSGTQVCDLVFLSQQSPSLAKNPIVVLGGKQKEL